MEKTNNFWIAMHIEITSQFSFLKNYGFADPEFVIETTEVGSEGDTLVIECGYEYLYRKRGVTVSVSYYFFNCSRLNVAINDYVVSRMEPGNPVLKAIGKREAEYVAFTQTHNTASAEYHESRRSEAVFGYLREYASIIKRNPSILFWRIKSSKDV